MSLMAAILYSNEYAVKLQRATVQCGRAKALRYFLIDGCTYPAVSRRADGRKLR